MSSKLSSAKKSSKLKKNIYFSRNLEMDNNKSLDKIDRNNATVSELPLIMNHNSTTPI